MVNKHWFGYGVLALIVVATLYWLHRQHVALVVAEEHAKAQDKIIQSSQEASASIEHARQLAIEDLKAERIRPATVETVVKELAAPLPAGSQVKVEQLPDAPAPQVVLAGDTQANLNFIRDQLLQHRECDVNLSSCKQQLAERQKLIAAETEKAKSWEQAAKGGSKVHRFAKILKVISCAGGGAALGSLWKARGAAIGGAVAAGACEITF